MPGLKLKLKTATKISKGAHGVKIKWDMNKHKRDQMTGRFVNKPGSEEFKAEPFGPGKTGNIKGTDVIKLHVTSNPKKPGSKANADFENYKDDMTVAEFKAAVGNNTKANEHLTYDTKKGFITIHDPATLPAKPLAQPEPPPPPKLTTAEYAITSKTKNLQPHDKIKLLAGHNPKKPGSKSAALFSNYKDEMTVAEFHAAIGNKKASQETLLYDLKKGFISVHNGADLADMQSGKLSPGKLAAHMQTGDKALGVVSKNPFTAGTKNYQDFEDAAFDQGLVTQAKVTASVDPATGAPKPKLADLDDNDIITSQTGATYNASLLKSDPDPVFKKVVDDNLASGKWTVKPKPVTLMDTDKVSVKGGSMISSTKYTVAEYKAITGMTDAQVQSALSAGKLHLHPPEAGAPAPKPATPTPAPAPKPLPKQSVEDDTVVQTMGGTVYTAAEYKAKWKANGLSDEDVINKLNNNIASGVLVVKTKSKFADNDVVETYFGNKYTIAQLKAKYPHHTDDDIQEQLDNGDLSFVAKQPPPPQPKSTPTLDALHDDDVIVNSMGVVMMSAGGAKKLETASKTAVEDALASGAWKKEGASPAALTKLSQIPKAEWDTHDVATITAANPYPANSEAWIKFKKIHNTSSGTQSMSVTKYMSSTTNVGTQEAVLDKMVADGHVKFVTPAQKTAVQAQKALLQQQAAAEATKKAAATAAAQKTKWNAHFQVVKEKSIAQFTDDPTWGSKPGNMLPSQVKQSGMVAVKNIMGLKYHSNSKYAGVAWYTNGGYSAANEKLRNPKLGHAHLNSEQKGHVKELDSLMSETKEDVVMWRGISESSDTVPTADAQGNMNNMPPPFEFVDGGYASMSFNPRVSDSFKGYSTTHASGSTYSQTGKRRTLFKMRIPKGSKAAFVGRKYSQDLAMEDEAEVITARGTRFKYISTTRDVDFYGAKYDIIELEIVNHAGGNI
jgi:hypothetical protein